MRAHVRRYVIAVGRCRRCGAAPRAATASRPPTPSGRPARRSARTRSRSPPTSTRSSGWRSPRPPWCSARFGGLRITPGGLLQALARLARAAEPTYGALVEAVRSPGGRARRDRLAGRGPSAWLWAFVGEDVTVYLIAPGRGYEQACVVLGADYAGVLERDGWAPYRRFEHARHQSCLAHLLRRTRR